MAWPGLGAGGNSALGIVLVIAACISYGFAVNLARPLQQRNGALPVVWRALLVALILTAPLGLPRALNGHWTPRAVLSLLALGALGTCVANVMTTIAAGRLGATSASVSAYFIPVVALLLGVLVRNEHVAALSLIGGAVSLVAAWVVRWASIRAAAAGRPPWPTAHAAAGEVGSPEACVRLDPLPIDAHVDADRRRRAAAPRRGRRRAARRRQDDAAAAGARRRRAGAGAAAAAGRGAGHRARGSPRSAAGRSARRSAGTCASSAGSPAATRVLLATEGILTARLRRRSADLRRPHDRARRVPRAIHPRRSRARARPAGVDARATICASW